MLDSACHEMASAYLRFYQELNDFLPAIRRQKVIPLAFQPPTPVRHLIETLGVPHTEVELILVNGLSVDLEQPIADGDHISVYPMFECFDIRPLLRVRAQPLRQIRFIADAHLGRLARDLRLLGFDTLFANDWGDQQLAKRAAADKRILLTRDRALLMHRTVTHGCYVRAGSVRQQLAWLIRRLDLFASCQPFSRCSCCNTVLVSVPKAQIAARLPPRTRSSFDQFWRCPGCDRIYWRGSHYQQLHAWLKQLQQEASACLNAGAN